MGFNSAFKGLTSPLDGSEELTWHSDRFTDETQSRYRMIRRLGGPHNRYGRLWIWENLLILPRFKPRTVDPVTLGSSVLRVVLLKQFTLMGLRWAGHVAALNIRNGTSRSSVLHSFPVLGSSLVHIALFSAVSSSFFFLIFVSVYLLLNC